LEFGVDAEESTGDEDDPSGAGFGAGFEVREKPVEVGAVGEVSAADV
jgi:hypothetical protein